jgi:hypothetical protein
MTVEVIDRGWNELTRRLFNNAASLVGFPVEKTRDEDAGGLTNVELAAIHEFGTADIPERSIIRAGFDEGQADLERFVGKELGRVVDGSQTVMMGLKRAGEFHLGQLKDRVKNGLQPGLADVTIAARRRRVKLSGGEKPLMDTLQLLNSMEHVERHEST